MTGLPCLDVDYCRRAFPPLENGWAYFENAGGSYVPRSVISRMTAFMNECQNQPDWPFESAQLAGERLETAQALMARTINAARDEIIIGPSTTLNVYVLAQALRPTFAAGDEIVVTNQDHEANSGAWRRLEEFGVVIREWRIDPQNGELDLADLQAMLTPRTRLVCFPHVSNVVGSINPVAEITARAHAVGARVCVDGVAYAAHAQIDVKALDVDFYLCSLYKLYGPHLALLYGKREAIAEARNQNHFFHDGNPPETLHPGGLNYEAVASLSGIVDYLDGVYAHHFTAPENDLFVRLGRVFQLFAAQEEACGGRLAAYLAGRSEIRLIGHMNGDRDSRMPTFSFVVAGQSSRAVAEALAQEKIAVGYGHFYGYRCVEALGLAPDDGVVRASLVHYNTLAEVERLIAALERIV